MGPGSSFPRWDATNWSTQPTQNKDRTSQPKAAPRPFPSLLVGRRRDEGTVSTGRCPVNLPPHAQLCSWGWLSGTYSRFSRTPGHRSRWERKKKTAGGSSKGEEACPGTPSCANLGQSDPGLSTKPKGKVSLGHTAAVTLPLTKLQAGLSHLQDAKAKGREKGKRRHGSGTGLGTEVGGNGRGRRPHCLATVPGHVHG